MIMNRTRAAGALGVTLLLGCHATSGARPPAGPQAHEAAKAAQPSETPATVQPPRPGPTVQPRRRKVILNPAYVEGPLTGIGNLADQIIAAHHQYPAVPINAYELTQEGDHDADRGDWTGAARSYQRVLKFDPINAVALYGMARCAAAAGDLQAELNSYRLAIYSNRPNGYLTQRVQTPGGPAQTVTTYIYGNGFREARADKLMEFALLLSRSGMEAESLVVFHQGVQRADYVGGNILHGRMPNPALPVLLPDLGPGTYTSQRLQALAHLCLGGTEPLAHLEEAARLYPDSAVVWYYLADELVFHGWKNQAEEKTAYLHARQLGDAAVQKALDRFVKFHPEVLR